VGIAHHHIRKTCRFPAGIAGFRQNVSTSTFSSTFRNKGAQRCSAIVSFKVIRTTDRELAVQLVGGAHPTRLWMAAMACA